MSKPSRPAGGTYTSCNQRSRPGITSGEGIGPAGWRRGRGSGPTAAARRAALYRPASLRRLWRLPRRRRTIAARRGGRRRNLSHRARRPASTTGFGASAYSHRYEESPRSPPTLRVERQLRRRRRGRLLHPIVIAAFQHHHRDADQHRQAGDDQHADVDAARFRGLRDAGHGLLLSSCRGRPTSATPGRRPDTPRLGCRDRSASPVRRRRGTCSTVPR